MTDWIANGESGSSVRAKLNTLNPWVRPGLSISGSGNNFTEWLNQTPTSQSAATATDGTGGDPLMISTLLDDSVVGGEHCITGLLKSKGATPWTISVGFESLGRTTGGTTVFCPIVVRNSGTDKAVALFWHGGFSSNNPTGGAVRVARITAASTGQSATVTYPNNDSMYGFPCADKFGWFRVVNDGTTLSFYIGPRSGVFIPLKFTETLATFIGSVDQVGFGLLRNNLTDAGSDNALPALAMLWDWREA